ncbi:MAG TPA: EamA family transporter [Oculatellaceae cyanobacterium]
MAQWLIYAWSSMFFAGFTSVIAKKGLTGISGDLGLTIRTCFVFLFVFIFAALVVPQKEWTLLKPPNWCWLAASAVTTFLSWLFYYRAIKLGEVSTVALIDKGSVVVSVVMATWLLQESLSVHKVIGAILIGVGLFVVSRG